MNNGNPFWMDRTSEPLQVAGWVPNRDETPGGVPVVSVPTPPPTPAAVDPFLATMGSSSMREEQRGPSPRAVPQFGVEFSPNGTATGYFEGKPFELLDPASWMELLIESYRLEREHTFARILTEVQQESRSREAVLKNFEPGMVSDVLPEPSGNDAPTTRQDTGRDVPTVWDTPYKTPEGDMLPLPGKPSFSTGEAGRFQTEFVGTSDRPLGSQYLPQLDLFDKPLEPRVVTKARAKAARRQNKPKRRVSPGKHSTPSIQSE